MYYFNKNPFPCRYQSSGTVRRGGDDEGGKTTLGNQRVDCVGVSMESGGAAVYKK